MSNLPKPKLLYAFEMHFAPSSQEKPMEAFRIGLLFFIEHHYGPDGPVVIVENHTRFCLFDGLSTLGVVERPMPITFDSPLFKLPILLDERLYFLISRPIIEVISHTRGARVSVIADPLIQIVSHVVTPGVPHSVLVINQH